MTDPNTPDVPQTPPAPPAAPAYGEYAPTPPQAAPPAYQQPAAPAYQQPAAPAYQQPAAPAYQQPAYAEAPAYPAAATGGPVPGKTLGIVAFILALLPIGLQLIGLILGIVALVQSKKAGRSNGFAIAAIILGALAVIIGLIAIFAFVVPSVNAAQACLNDPTAIVTVWGVDVPCTQVLEQSGR